MTCEVKAHPSLAVEVQNPTHRPATNDGKPAHRSVITCSSNSSNSAECFAAQWILNRSTRSRKWHFDVEILDTGTGKLPEIGVGLSIEAGLNSYPGWHAGSCGFHCDNALVYEADDIGKQTGYRAPCSTGDTVRCSVWHVDSLDSAQAGLDKYEVRFLLGKNDTIVEPGAASSLLVPQGDPVYPMVGFKNRGEKVRISVFGAN